MFQIKVLNLLRRKEEKKGGGGSSWCSIDPQKQKKKKKKMPRGSVNESRRNGTSQGVSTFRK